MSQMIRIKEFESIKTSSSEMFQFLWYFVMFYASVSLKWIKLPTNLSQGKTVIFYNFWVTRDLFDEKILPYARLLLPPYNSSFFTDTVRRILTLSIIFIKQFYQDTSLTVSLVGLRGLICVLSNLCLCETPTET